jgi:hypothetical protein
VNVCGCRILAQLADNGVAKHLTGGLDAKQKGCDDGDQELSGVEDEGERSTAVQLILNVQGRSSR